MSPLRKLTFLALLPRCNSRGPSKLSRIRKLFLVCALVALGLSGHVEAQCHSLLLGAGTCSAGTSPLLTSLTAYWDAEGAGDTDLVDVHGSNDLAESAGDTIASATGKVGNTRDFEVGETEWFSVNDAPVYSPGDTDFTFCVWVNIESEGAFRFIIGKDDNSTNREYTLDYSTADRFVFNVSANGTANVTVTANNLGAVSVATWYFLCAWHDASANKIFIQGNDGTADETAHTTGVRDGTAPFQIGATASILSWDGLIDEIGYWNRVLSAAERTWLYNSGSGRSYADIVACSGC
jgi:hypothetical protein